MLCQIMSKGIRGCMIGKVFGAMCIISISYGAYSGRLAEIGGAVFEGAESAISLTISLLGIMCLWCGIMQVLRDAGAIRVLSKILSPITRLFFPDAYKSGEGKEEISACIGANLLGIGNAATPLALSAIKKLHSDSIRRGADPNVASRDMITLAVLNTASVNFLPTTIIGLRRIAGASSPFSVVLPIWICSLCCAFLALLVCRACGMRRK